MRTFYISVLCVLFSLNLTSIASAQVDTSYKWTWIGGSSGYNASGIYGKKGVESPTNQPGARFDFASWKDFNGYFYIFGGYGYATSGAAGWLNDLWRFNPVNNQWTWMRGDSLINAQGFQSGAGIEKPKNTPSARSAVSYWASTDGRELYLFGGATNTDGGYDEVNGDVWGYNVESAMWRIIKFSRVDSLGNCIGQYYVSPTCGSAPDAFTKGVWPPCRGGATATGSAGGYAFMFGGSTSNPYNENSDFYKFSDYNYGAVIANCPQNSEWGAVQFATAEYINSQPGYYKGYFPHPGGRRDANSFTYPQTQENFYLFGGNGYGGLVNGVSNYGQLNDLWRYSGIDPTSKKPIWTWIKGDSTINSSGSYGTLGVTNLSNKPSARYRSSIKSTVGSQVILFGGAGHSATGFGYLNDLWSYDIQSNKWTWLNGLSSANDGGNYGAKGVQLNTNRIPAREGVAMWVLNDAIYVFAGSGGNLRNDMWKLSKPQDLITVDKLSSTSVCAGGRINVSYSFNLQAANPFSTNNHFIAELSDATGLFNNPVIIGDTLSTASGIIKATIPEGIAKGKRYKIRVRSTAPSYTSNPAASLLTVNSPNQPVITTNDSTTNICFGNTVTISSTNANSYLWNNGATTKNIQVNSPGNYYVTITDTNECKSTSLPLVINCAAIQSQNAYITNGSDSTVSVINTTSNSVISTIKVDRYPDGVVVSPDGNKVYITHFDYSSPDNRISIINAQTNTVEGSIKLNNGRRLSDGIDISPDGKELYIPYPASSGSDTLFVANTNTKSITAKIVLPGNGCEGIAVSKDGSKAYVAGNGVTVVDAVKNSVQSTLLTGSYCYGVAVNPVKPRVYVTDYAHSLLHVINSNDNSEVTAIKFTGNIFGVAVHPDGTRVYVAGWSKKKVYIVNANLNIITDSIAVNNNPYGLALTPDGSTLYVANQGSNNVSVINTTGKTIISTIQTGQGPVAFGKFIGITPCMAKVPKVTSNGSVVNICPDKTVTLSTNTALNYFWSTGENTSSISTSADGNYYVAVTDLNGCQNTSDPKTVSYQDCKKPTNLTTSNIASTSAVLNWAQADCKVNYEYQWRKKGTTAWSKGTSNSNSKTINGLTPATTYEWRVSTRCRITPDTIASGYTKGPDFTTVSNFSNSLQLNSSVISENTLKVLLAPNPAINNAYLTVLKAKGNVSVTLTDISGKILWQNLHCDKKSEVPLQTLMTGAYILIVKDDASTKILKVIKAR